MENAATIHVVSEVLVGNMQEQTCAPVAEDILEDFLDMIDEVDLTIDRHIALSICIDKIVFDRFHCTGSQHFNKDGARYFPKVSWRYSETLL